LSAPERGGAVLVGFIAAVLAYLALACPPEVERIADTTCCGARPQLVAADTETLVIVLTLISAVALLVALLGVRFTKISAGKDGVELAVVTELTGAEAQASAALRLDTNVVPKPSPKEWDKLPDWAQQALEQWAALNPMLNQPVRNLIVSAKREEKRGSRLWDVAILVGKEAKPLRLTYGRGSSRVTER
jgi:hypothetical protein